MNIEKQSKAQKTFWFHELPPFWIVVSILIIPPLFGTLFVYPKLSEDKFVKFIQTIAVFIAIFIMTYILNQVTKLIFKW
jgi:hypothetical protein